MQPTFSKRTEWDLQETPYAAAVRHARSQRRTIYDLTTSNPTTCGFLYEGGLLDLLRDPRALQYQPDPQGLLPAREAVAAYYREETGAGISPKNILLTTSTSEAYSFLFRLLCGPGDEVLIAQPSYPLFEYLADLDDVRLAFHPLLYDHGWHLDPAALRARLTPRTRAITVVQPNNPTGHFIKEAERSALEAICLEHGLSLIVDEVFLDYAIDLSSKTLKNSQSFACGEHPVLTFVLSGVSKICALPQMKAAWLLCQGPQEQMRQAMGRLEVIADTFLSMSAPIQHALPGMLAMRHGPQRQIRERVRANLATLDRLLAQQTMVSRLVVEAGWYAVLRAPALGPVDAAVVRLLEREQVLVHPGNFYGFSGDGWLVVSLLPPTEEFQEGMARLVRFFGADAEQQK